MTKKIVLFIIAFIFCISFCNPVKAKKSKSDYDIFSTAKDWIDYGEEKAEEDDIEFDYKNNVNKMVGTLQKIGLGIMIVIGVAIGISFMFASVDQKADIKKLLIPYLVGVVIIFGGITIWKFAITFMDELL